MAFDFGLSRIGMAVGQETTQTSSPLPTIKAQDGIPNWDELEKLVTQWQPDLFIVGLPLNMDGSMSQMSHCARKFGNRLRAKFRRHCEEIDERLTTREAKSIWRDSPGGINQKKAWDAQNDAVDSIAAQLLMETWFQSQSSPNNKD